MEGLDEEHLGLIAASLYGSVTSPVERRVEVMERYWEVFDFAHARQKSGMEPLWGLVSEDRRVRLGPANEGPYRHGMYERLLPEELSSEIEDLWGSRMVPRSLERIVTEPFPHTAMAESFGPALKFWQGCALTAWFLCEGPYSRTDLAGIESYHRQELDALSNLGTPVDRRLFSELVAAESKLGPEIPLRVDRMEIEPGVDIKDELLRRHAPGGIRDPPRHDNGASQVVGKGTPPPLPLPLRRTRGPRSRGGFLQDDARPVR